MRKLFFLLFFLVFSSFAVGLSELQSFESVSNFTNFTRFLNVSRFAFFSDLDLGVNGTGLNDSWRSFSRFTHLDTEEWGQIVYDFNGSGEYVYFGNSYSGSCPETRFCSFNWDFVSSSWVRDDNWTVGVEDAFSNARMTEVDFNTTGSNRWELIQSDANSPFNDYMMYYTWNGSGWDYWSNYSTDFTGCYNLTSSDQYFKIPRLKREWIGDKPVAITYNVWNTTWCSWEFNGTFWNRNDSMTEGLPSFGQVWSYFDGGYNITDTEDWVMFLGWETEKNFTAYFYNYSSKRWENNSFFKRGSISNVGDVHGGNEFVLDFGNVAEGLWTIMFRSTLTYVDSIFAPYVTDFSVDIGGDGNSNWNVSDYMYGNHVSGNLNHDINYFLNNGSCNRGSSVLSGDRCFVPFVFSQSGISDYFNYSSSYSFVNLTLLNVSVHTFKDSVILNQYNISFFNESWDEAFSNDSGYYKLFPLLPYRYEVNVSKEGYLPLFDEYVAPSSGGFRSLQLFLGYQNAFCLYDERTEGVFNMSSPDQVKFLLFCPDSTNTTIVTQNCSNINISCDYEKFKFVLDFGSISYYRTFLLPYDPFLNYSIYLIDARTTEYIYNPLRLDDLMADYVNPSIYVNKVIGGETVQITADFVDIENKIGAYLIRNNEYIVEIHSDNRPVRVMGHYSADLEGEKVLRVYDIDSYPDPAGFANAVSFRTWFINDSCTARMVYTDEANLTNWVNWTVRRDSYDGVTVYSNRWVGQNNLDVDYSDPLLCGYNLYSVVEFDHDLASIRKWGKIIHFITEISMGIMKYVSPTFLNWFFTLLLGSIALMATIKSANMVSMGIISFAAIFILFGWYSLSPYVLAIALLVSLISLYKSEDKVAT